MKARELDFKSRNGSHTCIQILKVRTAPWAKVNEPGLENTILRILMKDCTENSYFIGMILQENAKLKGLEAHLLFPTCPMGLIRWEVITTYKYIYINFRYTYQSTFLRALCPKGRLKNLGA